MQSVRLNWRVELNTFILARLDAQSVRPHCLKFHQIKRNRNYLASEWKQWRKKNFHKDSTSQMCYLKKQKHFYNIGDCETNHYCFWINKIILDRKFYSRIHFEFSFIRYLKLFHRSFRIFMFFKRTLCNDVTAGSFLRTS